MNAQAAQSLNSQGLAALDAGDAARAVELLRQAIDADPTAAMLWLNLSDAQRKVGDFAAEGASLDRAVELEPYLLPALVRRAEHHERMGEVPEAVHMWTAALTVAPPPERRNPTLSKLLDEKQAMIASHQAAFASHVDAGLEEARAGLDGADLRRFDRCIDAMLGRRRVFNSAPMGLNFPFLPQDEYLPRALFPWMKKLEAHTPKIRKELEALLADDVGFKPYVSYPAGAPTGQWDKLNGSLDWSSYFLWHFGIRQDEACEKCPETAAAMADVPLADVPGRAPTVFFSLLRPHSHIPAHVGVTNTRTIVHLPLIVPEKCRFRVGGETREWVEGSAFGFDDTMEHEAWNDSDRLRAVIIVDVWSPYLSEVEKALLRTFYRTIDSAAAEFQPRQAI